jgi:hypothetical protein
MLSFIIPLSPLMTLTLFHSQNQNQMISCLLIDLKGQELEGQQVQIIYPHHQKPTATKASFIFPPFTQPLPKAPSLINLPSLHQTN